MLLATALSALLVVGVMGVVTSITRANTQSTVDNADPADPSARALRTVGEALDDWADILAEELEQAEAIDLDGPDGLALLTYAGFEPTRRHRTHRPVIVRYALVERDGLAALVRQQAALDDPDSRGMQRDAVCLGVRRFELLPPPDLELDKARAEARARHDKPADERSSEPGHRWIELGERDDDPLYFRGVTLRAAGAGTRDEKAVDDAEADRWRLRVWMDDGAEPTMDRTLTRE
jgi:hypothetical protein